jgi:lysophospholipase L1-like esterase
MLRSLSAAALVVAVGTVGCVTDVAGETDDAGATAPVDAANPIGEDGGPLPSPDAASAAGALADVDDLSLVIVVGDSVAAGYNAAGNNGSGGRGYTRLLLDNHPDFPDYAGHTLHARWPAAEYRDLAESGATSSDARARVQSALGGSLPATVPGDVLVLINVGGNDFNDSIGVMINSSATATAAAELRANLADIVEMLRARYDRPAEGKQAVFLIDTIHDPTDGMGTVPPEYGNGFCETIQNPLFTPALRAQALTNLATMNDAITGEAAAQGATLVDVHAAFLGHGMHSGSARLIDTDCAHPTTAGHDHLRRVIWDLTGTGSGVTTN